MRRRIRAVKAASVSPPHMVDVQSSSRREVTSMEVRPSTTERHLQVASRNSRSPIGSAINSPLNQAARVAMARARESERSRRRVHRATDSDELNIVSSVEEAKGSSKIGAPPLQTGVEPRLAIAGGNPSVTSKAYAPSRREMTFTTNTSRALESTGESQGFHLTEGAHRRAHSSQQRYHVAFHAPVKSIPESLIDDASARTLVPSGSFHQDEAHSPVAIPPANTGHVDTETQGIDVWKTVDDSINHLYEDPPIDLVKSTLFHANLSSSGQSRKRLKQKQHQRILAAAEELRESKIQQQVERKQAWQKKERIQALSETIRQRNKKFARPTDGVESDVNPSRGQHASSVATSTVRKPPVPRLSGSRRKTSKRKRSQRGQTPGHSVAEPTESNLDASTSASSAVRANGAAASILLGDLPTYSEQEPPRTSVQEATSDLPITKSTSACDTDDQFLRRRESKQQASSAPRRQTSKQSAGQDHGKVSEALDHRRAVAREYMLLQQQQRVIRKAEARQRDQMDREKKRQQLEILESRRLEGLKHSRKRRISHQQVPPRRRNKSRMKPSARTESPSGLWTSGSDSGDKSKPKTSRSMLISNEEPYSDAENDGTHGNSVVVYRQEQSSTSMKPTDSSVPPSRSLLFADGGVDSSALIMEEEQPDAANAHIQRLLDLQRKAKELSQRLGGLHKTQKTLHNQEVHASSHSPDSAGSSKGETAGSVELGTIQPIRVPEREGNGHSQGKIESQSSRNMLESDHHDCPGKEKAEEAGDDEENDSRNKEDDRGYNNIDDDAIDSVGEGGSMEEDKALIELRQRATIFDADGYNMTSTMTSMSDRLDIDIRSIGVYNIAVVWPLAQDHSSVDSMRRFSEVSSDSSSSPSSQSSRSADDSDDMGGRNGTEVDRSHFSNSDIECNSDAEAESIKPLRAMKRVGRASEEWSASKMAELMRSVDSMAKFPLESNEHELDDREGYSVATWRFDMGSSPSDAFFRLVQAEDDSLSVIQRTALKLYERQQERERLRCENEKEKHLAPDVFDSSHELEESEKDIDSPSRQFVRLDEIMEEIDRERALDREAFENAESDDHESVIVDEDGDTDVPSDCNGSRLHARVDVAESSEFWNRMISTTGDQDDGGDDEGRIDSTQNGSVDRRLHHVEIDTSELEAQREQRLRQAEHEAEEEDEDGDDEFPSAGDPSRAAYGRCRRVDSPRTLAKRLLAEVEYHEAINDAHLKLTMMEQAQLLEQAQTESINIATAFKEEMEQNAVNHQLALDHAALAKQFDKDLHDVVEKLHDVEEVEEQERVAREVLTNIKLKQAHMRECSVQTEDVRMSTVGANSPVLVDAGSSPILPAIGVAMQLEHADSVPQATSPSLKLPVSIHEKDRRSDAVEDDADSSGVGDSATVDYGDDGFDQESGLYSPINRDQDVSDVEEAESIHIESEPSQDESRDASEAGTVVDSVTSLVETNRTANEEASEGIEEDENILSDTAESRHSYDENEDHIQSATAEYEDDFSGSSSSVKGDDGLVSSGIEDGFDAEGENNEDHDIKNAASIEDVFENDGDGACNDERTSQQASADSVKDDFDEEFAQSVDGDNAQEEELPNDDIGADRRSEADSDRSPNEILKISTKKATPQSAVSNIINATPAPAVRVETNVHHHDALAGKFEYLQQFTVPPISLYSQTTVNTAQTDQVVQAYMAELERRKQAESSMLSLRLQAAEAHFTHQARQIDTAIANTDLDETARAELEMRKQRLSIAFMGERANIESLKAAATARYFQDMLAFQSLYTSDSPSLQAPNGNSVNLNHDWVATTEIPKEIVTPRSKTVNNTKSSEGEAESECYEDEFASVTNDETGHNHSSIADDEDESVIGEEDDVYEEEGRSSSGSIASEVADIVEEPPNHGTAETISNIHVESNTKQDASRKGDVEYIKEEDEVHSDEYAQSEFEGEVQDFSEDHEEQIQLGEISENEYEVMSPDVDAVIENNGVGDNFEATEIESEDAEVNDGSVKSSSIEDGYDDDFASSSEGIHQQNECASDEGVSAIPSGREGINEEGESPFCAVPSESECEVSSNYSEDESNQGAIPSSRELNMAVSDTEGAFEASKRIEEIPSTARATTLDAADSVAQSASDDSSTTKLLVAEVDAFQKRSTYTDECGSQLDKLARKKAKVVELLEAKERLLQQQTLTFRLEEESRMVDEVAQLALGIDISQEFREAKASITYELQREFDTLKMGFPRLKKADTPPVTRFCAATVAADLPTSQTAPSVVQSVAIDTVTATTDDPDDGEYDAQSFEDASEIEDSKHAHEEEEEEEEEEEIPNDVPNTDANSDRVQTSAASENYSEFSEDASVRDEGISEGDGDDIGIQSEVEEEQNYIDDGITQDGERVSIEDEGYEDDYENESFADAQSVASVADEDDAVKHNTQTEQAANTADVIGEPGIVSAAQSDAASEYTEDDFEQASESEAAPSVHDNESEQKEGEHLTQADVPLVSPLQEPEIAHTNSAQPSESDHELSMALAAVSSQLGQCNPVHVDIPQNNNVGAADARSEHTLDRADESTREPTFSAMAADLVSQRAGQSISTSSGEETLSKSIEERVARLEMLKARILERQKDIRQVHKQLRVEKRKEALTAEEKLLWKEVEGLEHELQRDIASLDLMRQRNRLEFNQLEARQQLLPANSLVYERDLLIDFDHVEMVEPCCVAADNQRSVDVQTPFGIEAECQTDATPGFKEKELVSTYSSDLLAGYDFVEHALDVLPAAEVTTGRIEEEKSRVGTMYALPRHAKSAVDHSSPPCSADMTVEPLVGPKEKQVSVDLLDGFDYTEVVELLDDSKADLLAEFDYVESVEPLAEAFRLDSETISVGDQPLVEEGKDHDNERTVGAVGGIEIPANDDVTTVGETLRSEEREESSNVGSEDASDDSSVCGMYPRSDGESRQDSVYTKNTSDDKASTLRVSGPHDAGGGDVRVTEEAVADAKEVVRADENVKEAQAARMDDALTAPDANMVDLIASLIFADLLQDAENAADTLELNAKRKLSSADQYGHIVVQEQGFLSRSSSSSESLESLAADRSQDGVIRNCECDDVSPTQPTTAINALSTTEEPSTSSMQTDNNADLASKVDAVTESIFASVLDDALLSHLRSGVARSTTAHKQPQQRPSTTTREAESGAFSSSSSKNVISEPDSVHGVTNDADVATKTASWELFLDQTLRTLQVHDSCIRLDGFDARSLFGLSPGSARLLYDAIEEIGQSVLDAHLIADPSGFSASSWTESGSTEALQCALRQTIRRELEATQCMQSELHETASHQLKMLTDGDDQVDGGDLELLRKFTVRSAGLSNLVTVAAPTWIARPPSNLSASEPNGSVATPRTPTPTSQTSRRARRSLLTLARSRQAAGLQYRITSAILDELLEDALTSSFRLLKGST